jgi:malonate transporter and related proteins
LEIFAQIIPIFAVILTGYLAVRIGLLPESLGGQLIQFVYYVPIPAVLFLIIAQEEIATLLDGQFFLIFGGAVSIMYLVLLAGERYWRHMELGPTTMVATICVASNAAIIGLPVLHSIFGKHAAIYAAMANLFVVGLFVVQITLLEVARSQSDGATVSLLAPFRKAIINPVVLATLLGVAYAITPWGLPKIATDYLDVIGASLTPCALFAIGMSIKPAAVADSERMILFASAIKLAVLPALVLGGALLLGMGPLVSVSATLLAGMPTAKTEYILAKQYHETETFTANAVSVTTALALATLIGWLFILAKIYPAAFSN